jgi:hypothetical protein
MHAVEIQDHARRLLDAMGPKALAEAAHRARELADQGKSEQAEDWRRIEAVLRQMQGPRAK